MQNTKCFNFLLVLTIFVKTLNCMEAPAQPQTNQPLAPQIITLISSEGNRYTLNGPKLLQAEYFKTLLRFEQAKSKAPEAVTEINIRMPNAILEPITALINIAHASSELTEEQTISKLMEAIGNITNIDERIISLLIQAHTFEQPLVTKAIARCIAEVITEQDVIHFRQLAPNSEHQNLHPAYQVLIANEMQPTKKNMGWLLQWLMELTTQDNRVLLEPTLAINNYARFIALRLSLLEKPPIKNILSSSTEISKAINEKIILELYKIIERQRAVGISLDAAQVTLQLEEAINDNPIFKIRALDTNKLRALAHQLILFIQQGTTSNIDSSTLNNAKCKLRTVMNQFEGVSIMLGEETANILQVIESEKLDISRLIKKQK